VVGFGVSDILGGCAYVVSVELLLLVELRVQLVDAGAVVGGVATERDVQVLEEGVATREQRLGLVGVGVDARLAVEDDDAVGEIGGHDEIVLDDEGGLLGVHDEALDDAGGHDTLLGVEVWVCVSGGDNGEVERIHLQAEGSSMR